MYTDASSSSIGIGYGYTLWDHDRRLLLLRAGPSSAICSAEQAEIMSLWHIFMAVEQYHRAKVILDLDYQIGG